MRWKREAILHTQLERAWRNGRIVQGGVDAADVAMIDAAIAILGDLGIPTGLAERSVLNALTAEGPARLACGVAWLIHTSGQELT